MQQKIQQTFRHVLQQHTAQKHTARRGAAIRSGEGGLSRHNVKDGGGFETAVADTYLLRVGPQLWSAVVREGPAPAEDTRAALQAIRAALDAVRRLRFAVGIAEDERRRLGVFAAEAIERQECALRLWSVGRADTAPTHTGGSPAGEDSARHGWQGISGGRLRTGKVERTRSRR